MRIEITIEELRMLLDEQKRITVEKLFTHNYIYNKESDEGNLRSLPIHEEKFKKWGMEAQYPDEFNVLRKYIKD